MRSAESALLFGRGLKAGVDRREQKKEAAAHEAELLRKVREKQGVQETQEDRQRDRNRQAFAEGYERANMKVCSSFFPFDQLLIPSVIRSPPGPLPSSQAALGHEYHGALVLIIDSLCFKEGPHLFHRY